MGTVVVKGEKEVHKVSELETEGPRLEHWSVLWRDGENPYLAPEQMRQALHGFVYGRGGKFVDGDEVTTSAIVGRVGERVATKSGTLYSLGEADPEYEKAFPGARERVLADAGGDGGQAMSAVTPPLEPPLELSKLLGLALDDLGIVERSPDYVVDMGQWHKIDHSLGDHTVCCVCLAGAVMARLHDFPMKSLTRSQFNHEWRKALQALDHLSRGEVGDAFRYSRNELGLEAVLYSALDTEVAPYGRDRTLWWAQMRDLQARLILLELLFAEKSKAESREVVEVGG